jgi:hypothetical protein
VTIEPKNLPAQQLAYQARGNPPGAHPSSAVGNFFPGLEFNFLSVWRRFFVGIEVNESSGDVVGVDSNAAPEVRALLGQVMVAVDVQLDANGQTVNFTPVLATVIGPPPSAPGGPPPGPNTALGQVFLEWGNLLARLHHTKGGTGQPVLCAFQNRDSGAISLVQLTVRRLFDPDTALISRDAVQPGELTQSLCSPWQTDFIGCACYYWAANRPDYVNLWQTPAGSNGGGHNWLDATRTTQPDASGQPRPFYSLEPGKTLAHEDIIRKDDWERHLRFVIGGKDEGTT